jgi:hypothetical protein
MGRTNLTRWDLICMVLRFFLFLEIKILFISNVDNNQSEL